MRIDSVAHALTLTSFAFFLCSGLNSVSAKSSYNGLRLRLSDTNDIMRKPWLQPCGVEVTATPKKLERHNAHRTLRRVQLLLKVAKKQYENQSKFQNHSMVQVYNLKHYDYNYLPKNDSKWYNEEIACLDKQKKAEHLLPRLYDTLRRFSITFHYLINNHMEVTNYPESRRLKRFMKNICISIRSTLCEVDTGLQNIGLHLPAHNTMNITRWEKPDETHMLLWEWGVLHYYKNFVTGWKKIMTDACLKNSTVCFKRNKDQNKDQNNNQVSATATAKDDNKAGREKADTRRNSTKNRKQGRLGKRRWRPKKNSTKIRRRNKPKKLSTIPLPESTT